VVPGAGRNWWGSRLGKRRTRPIRLAFDSVPDADTLQRSIDEIPPDVWFDDPNGTPDHRKHLAKHFAEELRGELA